MIGSSLFSTLGGYPRNDGIQTFMVDGMLDYGKNFLDSKVLNAVNGFFSPKLRSPSSSFQPSEKALDDHRDAGYK